MAAAGKIAIEIALATSGRQKLISVEIANGTSARQAIFNPEYQREFPELNLAQCPLGVWGKPVNESYRLVDNDRLEAYRALINDPREARRKLAADGLVMGQGELPPNSATTDSD